MKSPALKKLLSFFAVLLLATAGCDNKVGATDLAGRPAAETFNHETACVLGFVWVRFRDATPMQVFGAAGTPLLCEDVKVTKNEKN